MRNDISNVLYGQQSPLVVLSRNPTEDNQLLIKEGLEHIARGLVAPQAVDIIIKYDGDLIKALQSGEIQRVGQDGLWFNVESYLRVCLIMDAGSAGVSPATPEGRIGHRQTILLIRPEPAEARICRGSQAS